MAPYAPPVVWRKLKYIPVLMPSKDGSMKWSRKAAVIVRVRRRDCTVLDAGTASVQGWGVLDSGASTSVVPLWLLQELGATISEESKRSMYSVSGIFDAYHSEVAMEMQYDNRWIDKGAVRVAAPDTKWSRDPNSRWPFLLGLDGLFSMFDVCINHQEESFRLGRAGDWPRNGIC